MIRAVISPAGIRAGLAAGMHVIGVTTPITRQAVHEARLLNGRFVVEDPAALDPTVDRVLSDEQRNTIP